MSFYVDSNNVLHVGRLITTLVVILLAIVIATAAGCPVYNVWAQKLSGEAELARASQNRQIAIQEAQAKRDAASMLAQAEVARAQGVAQANHIIGDSLHGNESYLRYLWITEVASGDRNNRTVVYVPTEANLPILEANRDNNPPPSAYPLPNAK